MVVGKHTARLLLAITVFAASSACTNDRYVDEDSTYVIGPASAHCDSCGNESIISGKIPYADYYPYLHIYQLSKNPKFDLYVGAFEKLDPASFTIVNGNFLYSPRAQEVLHIPGDDASAWSPDGNRLLMIEGYDNLVIYDIESKSQEILHLNAVRKPSWGTDSEHLWVQMSEHTYRIGLDGSITSVVYNYSNASEINDSMLIGILSKRDASGNVEDRIMYYNIITSTFADPGFNVPTSSQLFNPTDMSIELSPARNKALVMLYFKNATGIGSRGDGCVAELYVLDLDNNSLQTVKKFPHVFVPIKPKWCGDFSFTATHYCFTTRTALVYRYSLDGVILSSYEELTALLK